MRKKITYLLFTLCLGGLTFSTTACSSDDDNTITLEEQPFESVSGKYTVHNTTSGYEAIELTSSGSYIITTNGSRPYSAYTRQNGRHQTIPCWVKHPIQTRYSVDGKFIYGTFTKVSENTYNLEGFGLLTIEWDNGVAKSFDLVTESGKELSLSVTKEEGYEGSEATNHLCRTWKMIAFEEKAYENGELVIHIKYTVGKDDFDKFYYRYYEDDGYTDIEDVKEAAIQEYMEECPTTVTFSKAGTYIVTYNDNTMACSSWKWKDEERLQAYYDWEAGYEDEVNEYYVTFSFSGKQMKVTEIYEDVDETWEDETNTLKIESVTTLESLY